MITRIPAGLTPPKALGVAEVEKPQSGGADCGCTFIRLTDTVQGTERQSEIDKRNGTASTFLSSPSSTWRLGGTDSAQEVTLRDEQPMVVTGEEVPSAYGAPPGLSRSRFSNVTQAYVLPPWAFFFGELFEGQGFRHGPPDYLFTQEIEMGLPHRFGVAAETQFERFNGGGGAETVSLEARWALADWNKIPLNPTLFAEYKFGVGTIR